MAKESELELSSRVTCYQVNSDGSFVQTDAPAPSVYIKDTDVAALFNKEFTEYVKATYGPIIGVVQHTVRSMVPARQSTLMRILG